ncbi:MAG TPA: ABC transporter ATP-binding protein [Candidatus Copromorpha excrementigallinarum]|uniref:ABC transporter ATP-binding protein n=1 Tax=Candidatus Allocopromorpha excrementigallinarum TaxID=2840742 RepID=A0A9D1I3Y7_9FIRM|nr:ABC transporter ATP-binding protein [Candidatus Copromorpha excrementigallinarum]
MRKWLEKKFALTPQGAKDTMKAILASFLVSLSAYAPACLLLLVIDDFVMGNHRPSYFYVILSAATALVILVLMFIEYDSMYNTTYRESANLRMEIANRLNRLPLSYFSKHDTSDVTQTIMSDVEAIEHAMSHSISKFVAFLFSFPIIAIMLIGYNWKLGLTVILPILLGYSLVLLSKKVQIRTSKKYFLQLRKNSESFQEAIENAQEIRSFGLGRTLRRKLDAQMDESEKLHLRSEITSAVPLLSSNIVMQLSLALVILLGMNMLIKGEISVLVLTAYIVAALKVKESVDSISENVAELYHLDARIRRISDIRNNPVQEGRDEEIKDYSISLRDVTFSYSSDSPVLKGVTFDAKQGQVTALVGVSGCGKTSILRLISRLYDYDEGSITVGGKDIKEISTDSLFKNVSIVFQDVMLFNTSVMENIRLGRRDATDDEVIEAARLGGCHDFISRLPEGYNTKIGENGATLSGGERQRISIARAFLKDAPVIILDEIAAALDVENEKKIQDSLNRLMEGRTVIIISHRLKSVEHVDSIVVINDGRVEASGSHRELLKTSPTYGRLVENALLTENFTY